MWRVSQLWFKPLSDAWDDDAPSLHDVKVDIYPAIYLFKMDTLQASEVTAAASFIADYDTAQLAETTFIDEPVPPGYLVTLEVLETQGVLGAAPAKTRAQSNQVSTAGLDDGWFKDLATQRTINASNLQGKNAQETQKIVIQKFNDLRKLQALQGLIPYRYTLPNVSMSCASIPQIACYFYMPSATPAHPNFPFNRSVIPHIYSHFVKEIADRSAPLLAQIRQAHLVNADHYLQLIMKHYDRQTDLLEQIKKFITSIEEVRRDKNVTSHNLCRISLGLNSLREVVIEECLLATTIAAISITSDASEDMVRQMEAESIRSKIYLQLTHSRTQLCEYLRLRIDAYRTVVSPQSHIPPHRSSSRPGSVRSHPSTYRDRRPPPIRCTAVCST